MTIWNKRILIVLSLIMVLLMGTAKNAFAAEPQVMPDLQEDDGTLTVKVVYTDKDVETLIEGVELTIYKVADLTVNNGYAKYTLTEDFSGVDVSFDGMTVEQSIEAAKLFFAEAAAKEIEGTKAVSEDDGIASFGFVSHGAYLVIQSGATGAAKNYESIKPYLVLAPQPLVEVGINDWEYDVLSLPKMVKGAYEPEEPPGEKEKEKKKEEVKKVYKEDKVKSAYTGDEIMKLVLPILVIAMACAVLIVFIRRRRNNE